MKGNNEQKSNQKHAKDLEGLLSSEPSCSKIKGLLVYWSYIMLDKLSETNW